MTRLWPPPASAIAVPFTLASGWAASAVSFHRAGSTFSLAIQGLTNGGSIAVGDRPFGTVPAGSRPPQDVYGIVIAGDGSIVGIFLIRSGGNAEVALTSVQSAVYLSAIWTL